MPTFAVTILLPDIYEESFLALIPRHRSLINCLLSESVIETYAVSTERRRGWVTVNGDDTWVVRAVVEHFHCTAISTALKLMSCSFSTPWPPDFRTSA